MVLGRSTARAVPLRPPAPIRWAFCRDKARSKQLGSEDGPQLRRSDQSCEYDQLCWADVGHAEQRLRTADNPTPLRYASVECKNCAEVVGPINCKSCSNRKLRLPIWRWKSEFPDSYRCEEGVTRAALSSASAGVCGGALPRST